MRDCAVDDVVDADDIRMHRFEREELATGNLLEGGGGENVIDSPHRLVDARFVADVADIEPQTVVLKRVAHIVLFFLVAGKDADFLEIVDESIEYGMTETARTAGDQKNLVFE